MPRVRTQQPHPTHNTPPTREAPPPPQPLPHKALRTRVSALARRPHAQRNLEIHTHWRTQSSRTPSSHPSGALCVAGAVCASSDGNHHRHPINSCWAVRPPSPPQAPNKQLLRDGRVLAGRPPLPSHPRCLRDAPISSAPMCTHIVGGQHAVVKHRLAPGGRKQARALEPEGGHAALHARLSCWG